MNKTLTAIPDFLDRRKNGFKPKVAETASIEAESAFFKAAGKIYRRRQEREEAFAVVSQTVSRGDCITLGQIRKRFPDLEEWAIKAALRRVVRMGLVHVEGRRYVR